MFQLKENGVVKFTGTYNECLHASHRLQPFSTDYALKHGGRSIEEMPEKKFRSQSLICGCCGCGFKTWELYKDQDQDEGYGICSDCQDEETKRNEEFYEETFQQIYKGTSEKGRAKIDANLKEIGDVYKTILVNICIEKGYLKWEIKKN